MAEAKWIWKYRDFEKYHAKRYLLAREERGKIVPGFYEIPQPAASVRFCKTVELSESEIVNIKTDGTLCFMIDWQRQNGGTNFEIPAGKHSIQAFVGNMTGMCAVYIEGKTVVSDESFVADAYDLRWEPVGTSPLCYDKNVLPSNYTLPEKQIFPILDKEENGSRIIDFGDEVFIKVELTFSKAEGITDIFYGESLPETFSDRCVIVDKVENRSAVILPARACRYIRFTGNTEFSIKAYSVFLPLENKASFKGEKLLTDIFDISVKTLALCSKMFFLDGIKRDRWSWAGDAMISARMNYYSYFDTEIVKRTLIALRGGSEIKTPVNNILDYSFYWLIMAYDYYLYTADEDFINKNYDIMKATLEYYISRCDSNGFVPPIGGVWLFIDWHDIERKGAVCVIQMLYAKSVQYMAFFAELCNRKTDEQRYKELYNKLFDAINRTFWNEDLGAYVSSFDGKTASVQVRRHQNYLGVLLGFADEEKRKQIIERVCLNSEIPKITTPFFRFFELDMLCTCGHKDKAFDIIRDYWGGIISCGAQTVWEEYDSCMQGEEHYAMYDEPFDKSLCHAWGAGPLYFIGKHLAGVYPNSPGYKTFTVCPETELGDYSITVPVYGGKVEITYKDKKLSVRTDKDGGTLIYKGKNIQLPHSECITV